jgi:hypothetical protein
MIIRLAALFGFSAFLLILWEECGQNLPLFCYRLGLGAALRARSHALATVPLAEVALRQMRSRRQNQSFALH